MLQLSTLLAYKALAIKIMNRHGFSNKACPEHLRTKEEKGHIVLAVHFSLYVH